MKTLLSTILLLTLSPGVTVQSDCSCCSEAQRALDFWIGEWTVSDTSGKEVGQNTISLIEDGCALEENWKGKKGATGTSLNYYNKNDSTWNQVWVDNKGIVLNLKGNIENGSMILKSDTLHDIRCGNYLNQISWKLNSNGTVTQKWEMVTTNGQVISTVFYGIYRKKK